MTNSSRSGSGSETLRTPPRLDELLAETSRTFALTIPLLPEPTRGEVTTAYLLFRIADTLEDATLWTAEKKRAELGRLSALLQEPDITAAEHLGKRWAAVPPCEHRGYLELLTDTPVVVEFLLSLSSPARETIGHHISRTIERMCGFVSRERDGVLRLDDLADLRRYCYAVAGIVGEMLTELFLLERENLAPVAGRLREDASSFGEALQLVNILKDSNTDTDEGRNYIPAAVAASEVFELARADLRTAGRYCSTLHEAGAPRGLVEFTSLPVLLAWDALDVVRDRGPGAKVTRSRVAAIVGELSDALDKGELERLWRRFRESP